MSGNIQDSESTSVFKNTSKRSMVYCRYFWVNRIVDFLFRLSRRSEINHYNFLFLFLHSVVLPIGRSKVSDDRKWLFAEPALLHFQIFKNNFDTNVVIRKIYRQTTDERFKSIVYWNSIVRRNHELRVEVRFYGHWDVPLLEGGQVHSLDSD